jgi:hypothetical protein
MNTTMVPRVHPAGEGVFEFPTAGGKVRLQSTADVLTPYGGLVPWAAFARHTDTCKVFWRPLCTRRAAMVRNQQRPPAASTWRCGSSSRLNPIFNCGI